MDKTPNFRPVSSLERNEGKDTHFAKKSNRYVKPLAVKELEAMSYEANRKRFPGFPYPVKRSYRDDTANGLTACVIDYLRLIGMQAERINSTGRVIDQNGNSKWITGSGTKGTADISATIAGKSVKIEIKIGIDRQSDYQKAYQKSIEAAGGIYIIVRTFTQFRNWFDLKFTSHGKRQ